MIFHRQERISRQGKKEKSDFNRRDDLTIGYRSWPTIVLFFFPRIGITLTLTRHRHNHTRQSIRWHGPSAFNFRFTELDGFTHTAGQQRKEKDTHTETISSNAVQSMCTHRLCVTHTQTETHTETMGITSTDRDWTRDPPLTHESETVVCRADFVGFILLSS